MKSPVQKFLTHFSDQPWLIISFSALILVGCLIIFTAILLMFQPTRNLSPRLTPLSPTATLPITSQLPTATNSTQSLFMQVEDDLAVGNPQQVLDTLLPRIRDFAKTEDRAKAYNYLSQAEMQLGHYQLAAAYFEKVYALQPTATHIFELARMYDLGGDLENAFEKYQILVERDDQDAVEYHQIVQNRLEELYSILRIPTQASP